MNVEGKAHDDVGGVDVQRHTSMTSAVCVGERSALHPSRAALSVAVPVD
jgi:hypothetical protein